MESSLPNKPRLCVLVRGTDGYGFNLHGEKGQHGQYIRAVDSGSPAETSGLRAGDRVIEVDGVNIERETHSQVVARIKAGNGRTNLLVVDRELDAFCRKNSITIKATMAAGGESGSPKINGDYQVESEVHMNGHITENAENGEVIVASIGTAEESVQEMNKDPEPQPVYAEIDRRVEEDEMGAMTAAEIVNEMEEKLVDAQSVEEEESVPDMAQGERQEEQDGSVPEPEPEPILEAATVPVVKSAPPQHEPDAVASESESEPEPEPEQEPVRAPTPEPVRAPTPEPVRAPTPEPVREPTPEPPPEPKVVPKPEPVVAANPKKTETAPPRPTAAPTQDNGMNLTDMSKARQLAGGRKKKKQASSKDWGSKYAAFNNL